MNESGDENRGGQGKSRRAGLAALAILLWLATGVLGGLAVMAVREIIQALFVTLVVRDRTASAFFSQGVTLVNWATFFLAVILVVVVVGGGEYHLKNFGKRGSWRLFAWVLGIELALIAVGMLV